MIKQIFIKDKDYKKFELEDLTSNTIILFSKPYLKNFVEKRISEIWELGDNDDDSLTYWTDLLDDKEKVDDTKCNIAYLPTTVVNLQGGQRFIFTVEPAFILQATDRYDIWFVDENDKWTKDGDESREITCWALTDFKGHQEDWNEGVWKIYKKFCCGMYGCYRGYGR